MLKTQPQEGSIINDHVQNVQKIQTSIWCKASTKILVSKKIDNALLTFKDKKRITYL